MSRLIKITDPAHPIEAGVIPALGGMVALFRIIGKPNVLKADPALWDQPPYPPTPRVFGPDPAWNAYNGHIVWLGPQSEWWLHQTKSPKKRREKAVWPPDPYINNGNFKVIEKDASSILMQGPESEFSGVQLTKLVKMKNGKLLFRVTAQNIRDVPVSWDLWLNTRVDGYARCYAPVASLDKIRMDGEVTDIQDKSIFSHDRGYCRIEPRAPSKSKMARWAKAFIPAQKGFMAAFTSSQALVIKFKKHPQKLIHPEQALVEIYNYTTHNRDDALTELEYHAPYITLAPGESMEASQTWELYPFKVRPGHEDCIEFLQGL